MKTVLKIALFCASLICLSDAAAEPSAVQKMLKPYIELQCAAELKASNVWKASTYFMTERNKSQFGKDVCGCVSSNALNDVPAAALAHAAVSAEVKNQLIKKAMLNTAKSCIMQQKM